MSDHPELIEWVDEGWTPRGELEAERALRGLDLLAAKFQEVHARAVEYRADIDAWEQMETGKLRGAGTRLVLGLQSWARDLRIASAHKTKRWSFPTGVIESKAARSKTEVDDEAALMAWCEQNVPDAVKVEKKVLVSVLQKAEGVTVEPGVGVRRLLRNGEIVPGVRVVVPTPERFSVEVKLASQRALPAASDGN